MEVTRKVHNIEHRLSAHRMFKPSVGMLVFVPWGLGYRSLRIVNDLQITHWTNSGDRLIPDLQDFATCGVLMQMVSELVQVYKSQISINFKVGMRGEPQWSNLGSHMEPYEIYDCLGHLLACTLMELWS
jgi:hypothetical protein